MTDFRVRKSRWMHSPPASSIPLTAWKEALRDAPDLRWERVERIRDAIRQHSYNEASLIERVLDCVEDEIGILCRRS